MKWYPHDPSAFLAGVIGLDAEERGFYITVIDLLYARDGNGVTDRLVCSAMDCAPQVWRRVKPQLIHKGKVYERPDGSLMANRVETTLKTARKLASSMSVLRRRQLEQQALSFGGTARKPITIKKGSYYGEVQQGSSDVSTELMERVGKWKR